MPERGVCSATRRGCLDDTLRRLLNPRKESLAGQEQQVELKWGV